MPGPSAIPAVVMGDADLERALELAGIPHALFAEPREQARRPRGVRALPWRDHWEDPGAVVDVLLDHARATGRRPVLFPQTDGDLLTVSRHRERLAAAYDFVLADAEVVEAMVNKELFARVAAKAGLPVPESQEIDVGVAQPANVEVDPPLVVKPLLRRHSAWRLVEPGAKAVHVGTRAELERLWPRLVAAGLRVLVQQAVAGPEARIESYHGYVAADGRHVAGFTGRKIRTLPAQYGHSSAVAITAEPEVEALGREVLDRLGVRGVAKVDFKRDDAGRLWLLEVNPRFTLWHHPGAVAGVNIPALVHADLTGGGAATAARARPGVTWCHPRYDVRAARACGVGPVGWLRFVRRCEAVSPRTVSAAVQRRLGAGH